MTVKVIDISHWQGNPDFAKVRAAGVVGVIHKATEGADYVDPERAKNLSAALDAGLKIATYHWLSPDADVEEQIAHYLDTVDPVAGERVIIDYEEKGCTLQMLHDAVGALLQDGRDLQVTIYSGHLLKEQLGATRDEFLAENTDLWLAQYTTGEPSWPDATYPQWALWQYTDQGNVAGVNGDCDCNRFYSDDDEELIDWFGPVESADGNERQPMLVRVEITVPSGVAVIVAVNGMLVGGAAVDAEPEGEA